MQRCDHDEANTRSTVHVLHALNKGYNQVSIRTIDTDVVILMGLFPDLIAMHLSASILFGLDWGWGKISRICASLGPKTSRSLRIFHSFTGCDTNFRSRPAMCSLLMKHSKKCSQRRTGSWRTSLLYRLVEVPNILRYSWRLIWSIFHSS